MNLLILGNFVAHDGEKMMLQAHRKQSLELDRHFLHATRLKIILPGEKDASVFEAELPEVLGELLEELRGMR